MEGSHDPEVAIGAEDIDLGDDYNGPENWWFDLHGD